MNVFYHPSSKRTNLVLLAICALSFGLMLHASQTDSAIMDELAHIPAGYGYVHELDYRLNPEHPPLIKALAALPLLAIQPHFPTNTSYWQTDINGQWAMGTAFLYESGNDADEMVRLARLGPMLLTIFLVLLVYLWSRELLGSRWALFPTALFALSPTTLAHGHYVTTDVGAAFGAVFATYFFLRYLYEPRTRFFIYTALAFGIAELAKFSTVLLIPYFVFLALAYGGAEVLRETRGNSWSLKIMKLIRSWVRLLVRTIFIFALGYILLVYPAYWLFTLHYPISKQVSDTTAILQSFADGPTPAGAACHLKRCFADLTIRMSGRALTRPLAEYALGVLMVFQRAAGGNTGYFLGQVSSAGWRSYFPIVYVLKETLPVLILILIGFIYSITSIVRALKRKQPRFLDYLGTHFTEFSMISFVIFYWGYSMKSPLNIGVRHLFPTFPFIYVLTASALKQWVHSREELSLLPLKRIGQIVRGVFRTAARGMIVIALFVWFLVETLYVSPHFLSYFNELGSGAERGYRYVTDSNYDWGQDLLRLKEWVRAHPEIDRIAIDYFGGGSPTYYMGERAVPWSSSKGNPNDQGIHWLAVSVNTLEGAMGKLVPGEERDPENEYRWLAAIRPPQSGMGEVPSPDLRAGTSIFIYHLQ